MSSSPPRDPASRVRFIDLSEETRSRLKEGIAEFNAGRWWEAHEAWEVAWQEEDDPVRLWLQGLIQLAAAYHKGVRMLNPRGMAALFTRSLEKLDATAAVDPGFGGVDASLLCGMARQGLEAAQRWQAGTTATFDRVPGQIALLDSTGI